MPTNISTKAIEGGTYAVTVAFTDESGDALVPLTITWTLTDTMGNVVNSRRSVSVTPASSVTVVLYGDDLKISTFGVERIFTIEGTFNSVLGLGLPFKDTMKFEVVDIVAVSS